MAAAFTPVTFVSVTAGAFTGRADTRDGQPVIMIADAAGRPLASIGSRMAPIGHIGRPRLDGILLGALSGAWFLPEPAAASADLTTVLDQAGNQVAALRKVNRSTRQIMLPGGTLDVALGRMKPQYRIDGMFAASRTKTHALMPNLASTIFAGEIAPGLMAAPDAPLIFALASLITWRAIHKKADDEAWRTNATGS